MIRHEWFKEWFNSPFYHRLYFEHDELEAQQFIAKALNVMNPAPGSRMLDVACGRGRHSRFLASLGYDVTGIDLSPESIAFAGRFAFDRLHFYQHDMRHPFWTNYFDQVFNLFTSFGYFSTRREHDAAVRTMANALKPSGKLLIDYLNTHYVEEHLVPNETKIIGNTIYEIRRWQDLTHFYKQITVTDLSIEKPIDFTEKVVKFSLGDFTDLLSYHSVQVKEVFGDYKLSPYHIRNTPRLILIGQKAGL